MAVTTESVVRSEAPARRRERLNSSRMSEQAFAYWLIVPVLVVLLAIMIYPTLYSIYISFNSVDVATDTWEAVGLQNYVDAFNSQDVRDSIWTTVRYTIYVTVFSTLLAVGGALLLNEKFRGRAFLSALVILPWSVSTYAAAVVFKFMYSPQSGLFNSILVQLGVVAPDNPFQFIDEKTVLISIAIAHAWQFAPLGMYFMLAALQVVPRDLYKVAKTDRLNVWRRFQHVIWPYLKTPILIYLVLVTAEAAKVFDIIYFMSGGGPGTASLDLVYNIYKETFVSYNLGYGAAISYILVVIILVITTVYFLLITMRQKEEHTLEIADAESAWKTELDTPRSAGGLP
ncbi:MAG: sugar ABC transporter permease [Chloroflexota bacterium]|nr:sugar ABC transporter permease [Chloroflexota bacterium]